MLLRIPKVFHHSIRFVQALYVSVDKMQGNKRILTPTLDIDHRLSDRTVLKQNINRRKSSLNVDDLLAQWDIYKTVESKKEILRIRQKQVSKLLKDAKKAEQTKDNLNIVRKHTIEEETIKIDLQNLIEHSTSIEDVFVNNFLALPNDILDTVPTDVKIISTFGEKPLKQQSHHLSYQHVIDFYDEFTYFLKGDAAIVDGLFPMNCVDYFRQNGFIHFNNPDYVKTILVEGAGYSVNDVYEVTHHMNDHHTNVIHLAGNGSMLSFLGFITKLRVSGTLLPLKWISAGKTYARIEQNDNGLFNVSQSTTVQVFLAGTKEQMELKYDETLELIIKLLTLFNAHYRVVHVPAFELNAAECFSTRIEMFSSHFNKYIEIANLSKHSDYISKRLLFSYEKDKRKIDCEFAHTVSGTVCNVTRLIGILLETNNGTIPNDLLKRNLF